MDSRNAWIQRWVDSRGMSKGISAHRDYEDAKKFIQARLTESSPDGSRPEGPPVEVVLDTVAVDRLQRLKEQQRYGVFVTHIGDL